MNKNIILILILGLFISCNNRKKSTEKNKKIPTTKNVNSIEYNVTNYYPHDRKLFTEGFIFYEGELYESSGSPSELPQTESVIGISDLSSGKFERKISLDKSKYFGEGIVFLNNKLYQLTYKSQTVFVYNAKTFKKIGQFKYKSKEGWGLTTDGQNLIMSDGTNVITYINPENFKPIKEISVTEENCVLNELNELEYINGFIYANLWKTNYIVKINPQNGKVIGKLNLSPIGDEIISRYPDTGVMNGIAYNSVNDKIYITGKLWPYIYEIEFNH